MPRGAGSFPKRPTHAGPDKVVPRGSAGRTPVACCGARDRGAGGDGGLSGGEVGVRLRTRAMRLSDIGVGVHLIERPVADEPPPLPELLPVFRQGVLKG